MKAKHKQRTLVRVQHSTRQQYRLVLILILILLDFSSWYGTLVNSIVVRGGALLLPVTRHSASSQPSVMHVCVYVCIYACLHLVRIDVHNSRCTYVCTDVFDVYLWMYSLL